MPSCQSGRKTLMFSATFPTEIQKLAKEFMGNYVWIGVGRVGGAVETVTHEFLWVTDYVKKSTLQQLLREHPDKSTIVFVGMKRTAAQLEMELNMRGFRAVSIHGDMEQPEREASLRKFK